MNIERTLSEVLNVDGVDVDAHSKLFNLLFTIAHDCSVGVSITDTKSKMQTVSTLILTRLVELNTSNADLQIRLEGVHKGLLELQKKLLK